MPASGHHMELSIPCQSLSVSEFDRLYRLQVEQLRAEEVQGGFDLSHIHVAALAGATPVIERGGSSEARSCNSAQPLRF